MKISDDFYIGCVIAWFLISGTTIICELHNNNPGIGMGVAPPIDVVITYTFMQLAFFAFWIVPLGAILITQCKRILRYFTA